MNVDVPRPALLAARRLGSAVEQLHSTLPVPAKETNATGIASVTTTTLSLADRSESSLFLLEDNRGAESQRQPSKPSAFEIKNERSASKVLAVRDASPTAGVATGAATAEEAGATALDAPPLNAELTGMGPLPFAWYEGSVEDLAVFGEVPLEIDEVASAPDVSQHFKSSSRLTLYNK